jgi:hypothetical protein
MHPYNMIYLIEEREQGTGKKGKIFLEVLYRSHRIICCLVHCGRRHRNGRLICVGLLYPLAKSAINFSGRQWQNVVANEV